MQQSQFEVLRLQVQHTSGDKRAECDKNTAEECRVEPGRDADVLDIAQEKQNARTDLQRDGEALRVETILADRNPQDSGRFQRPGGAAPVSFQCIGDGQRGEHHADREHRFRQQAEVFADVMPGISRQHDIVETHAGGRAGDAVVIVVQHQHQQARSDDRRAEHHRAVDQPGQVLGLAQRVKYADQAVHQEEQQQESQRRVQVVVAIVEQRPQHENAEGENKAEQVERTPGTEPGNGKHRRV